MLTRFIGFFIITWAALFIPFLHSEPAKELVRGNGGAPQTLDPHLMEGPREGSVAYDIFEGLVSYDNDGQLIPGQAESWAVLDDGRRWVFQLREGLKWSDGKSLTAEDFEYSFKRMADPETAAPYAWFLETLELKGAGQVIQGKLDVQALGVKAISSSKLEFLLNQPVNYFPELLGFYGFLPVPRHVIEAKGAKWTQPENIVSNGPFKLSEWKVNEKLVAVRNHSYWADASTKLEKVTYITSGDEFSRFRSGEIHITQMLKPEHEKWVKKHHPQWLYIESRMHSALVFLNLEKPKLQVINNRRALALALDRESMAQSSASGTADAAWQVVPSHFDGFDPVGPTELSLSIKERSDLASKLIDLKELNLIYCSNCDKEKTIALFVAQEWQKRLGLKVNLVGYERKYFYSALGERKYDATIIHWMGPFNNPASLLNIFSSLSASNRSYYQSRTFDGLLAKARSFISDPGQSMKTYAQAEELLMEDIPVIPVLHHKGVRLVSEKVKGYSGLNPMGRIYSRHLSLDR